MLSSKDAKGGLLRITSPTGVETIVLRADMSVVTRLSSGENNLELDAGIYKILARTGDASQSQLVEVVADEEVRVRIQSVRFASAAPLAATRKTHEYHIATAESLSRGTPEKVGQGAQLFLYSRYWTGEGGKEKPVRNASHPLSGVSLHRLDGAPVIDVERASRWITSDADQHAGLLVELDPGAYRLRLTTQVFGAIEQCVVVCPGWQTQVFTLVRDLDEGPAEEHLPDLASAAILMTRMGEGFVAGADQLALIEVARASLIKGRALLDSGDMQALLHGKFDNPMLGILGAHLLQKREAVPTDQMRTVVNNLRGLTGVHPDVEILAAAYLGERGASQRDALQTPPMLAAGWELLLDLTLEDETLIPPGGLTSGIGAARWGSGAWLNWSLADLHAAQTGLARVQEGALAGDELQPQRAESPATSPALDPASSLDFVRTNLNRLVEKSHDLSGFEQAMLQALQSSDKGTFASQYRSSVSGEGPEEKALSVGSLAKAFRMPGSSVNSVLSNLARKLAE